MSSERGLTQTPALHKTKQSGGQSNEYRDRAPGSGLRPGWKPGDHLRDRQAREAGGRRRRRPQWRDDGARHRSRTSGGPRRRGLLPADDRRRRADVRRRQDPGRLLQARGPRERARHPDRPHDRPPDPAALAEGLPQRGAGHLHRPLRGHGHPARHPVHQRRVGGAHALAAAVLRPGRGGAHRPDRRRARRQPDAAAELGGDVARPDRRRHEGRPDDGRGRRRRGARGRAPRGARARPRRDPASSARRRRICAARPASRSGSTWTSPPRSRRQHGHTIWERIQSDGLREAAAVVDELVAQLAGEISMDSTEEDIQRQMQVRASLDHAAREAAARRGRRPGARAVRERPAGAHRRRAGLEGAEVGEAPPALRADRQHASSCRSRSARPPSTARARRSRTA